MNNLVTVFRRVSRFRNGRDSLRCARDAHDDGARDGTARSPSVSTITPQDVLGDARRNRQKTPLTRD
eukprot:1450520-Prymnesium_polylepis.1